ncbi:MAG: ribonuclease G [Gammaproteobacteria bacterium]|nr:ribonuclease G [Gammaproteobacteria bacterium]
MSNEILINVTSPETRVALVENGVLHELIIERSNRRGLVGNIYKGTVCRVLPGMQAAFVDIGLDRAAFLHASDLVVKDRETLNTETIDHFLKENQTIIVQVTKDPLGNKGARLTSELAVPSRFMVYMPHGKVCGVSQRIECEEERNRLRSCMEEFREEFQSGSYIARTASEGIDPVILRADMLFLLKLWNSIEPKLDSSLSGTLVHQDLPLSVRVIRDLYRHDIDKIRVDSAKTHERLINFAQEFAPELTPYIEFYTGDRPLFDIYSVEDEVQKALSRKVALKSGGHLVFDQTEAMTTVDVNTGAYVGKRSLEETIFKTNLEAAQVIARQLRVRNLGGIIILDFIDMHDQNHRDQVLQALEKHLERDHAKTTISQVSPLGLVEMTRKRTRESLEHILCEPCSSCEGRGVMKTAETTCLEIFREIIREARQYDMNSLLVLANNAVVERLLDEEADTIAELERTLAVHIKFRAEAQYSQEQYDVVLL